MTHLEKQIIGLVMGNKYLDESEKARYVSAMMLMTPKEQKELLKKIQNFDKRSKAIEEGRFGLKQKEISVLQKIFHQIKDNLIKKLKKA